MQHLHGMIALMKNFIESNQLPAFGIPMLILSSEPSSSLYDYSITSLVVVLRM